MLLGVQMAVLCGTTKCIWVQLDILNYYLRIHTQRSLSARAGLLGCHAILKETLATPIAKTNLSHIYKRKFLTSDCSTITPAQQEPDLFGVAQSEGGRRDMGKRKQNEFYINQEIK